MTKLQRPSREQALQAVKALIAYIGDDPDRQGLVGTPERVIKAWEKDWGIGYNQEYQAAQKLSIVNGQFKDGSDDYSQMILVSDIKFHSHCEHHMAPFSGSVDIAYIPSYAGPILGLSKLVRVVDIYSRRLQVQERLTVQIADFIEKHCSPLGVGVRVQATHGCMISRGVKQTSTVATTSALRGEMLTEPEVRDEFLRLVGK